MNTTTASTRAPETGLDNAQIADRFEEVAALLEAQSANPFRIDAYRAGATTLRGLRRPVREILDQQGPAGLMCLSGIGHSLAHAIEQLACTGRFPLLDRLRGDGVAERMFATVPDIGPTLAVRIHEHLGIETLSELEVAARDGRLATVPGMGPKRLRAVRESLAGRLHRQPVTNAYGKVVPSHEPPLETLLDIDREYLNLASLDRLPKVAPRRFNPTQEAWLPILHTQRLDHHYTAIFSNTARAHELGKTHDWVVIYLDDRGGHGQWTVITSDFGLLAGKRIVRGREDDCRRHYERQEAGNLKE